MHWRQEKLELAGSEIPKVAREQPGSFFFLGGGGGGAVG